MSNPLERRYKLLLCAYPRSYRREHSEEMLSTLLEMAGPGQRSPSLREAAALGTGGLRARARVGQQTSPADVWLGGLHLTVGLILLLNALLDARYAANNLPGGTLVGVAAAAEVLLNLGAYGAVARRRYLLGLTLAVLAQATELATILSYRRIGGSDILLSDGMFLVVPVLLLPLLRRRPAATPPPGYLATFVPAFVVSLVVANDHPRALPMVFLALATGYLLWAWIDVRITIALGGFGLAVLTSVPVGLVTAWRLNHVAGYQTAEYHSAVWSAGSPDRFGAFALATLLALALGALLARRQTAR